MSRKFPPNRIIYSKRGRIYNALCGICLILGFLLIVSTITSDLFHKGGQLSHSLNLWAVIILIFGFIFERKSSKHSTITFL